MKKQIRYGAALMLVSLLAACATKTAEAPPGEDKAGAAAPAGAARSAAELELAARQQQLLSQTTIYFAFDSSAVDEQARAVIEAHAAHLSKNPRIKIGLEGHCDERGTREYNLALAERRAQAVEKLMKALGVPGAQLETVSYGEEKPVDPGHDESAWRKNRRVKFDY